MLVLERSIAPMSLADSMSICFDRRLHLKQVYYLPGDYNMEPLEVNMIQAKFSQKRQFQIDAIKRVRSFPKATVATLL